MSPGKRLDQLSEEAEKSGNQQPHAAGRCGALEGLVQKRGGDRHLGRIGEQLGRLRAEEVSPVLLHDTRITLRSLTELNKTDCSCYVFLVY
jgi:hypothetical protein